jgi:hypothetical protein
MGGKKAGSFRTGLFFIYFKQSVAHCVNVRTFDSSTTNTPPNAMPRTATQVLQGFYTAAMCADADDARTEYRRLFDSATPEEMQLPAVARRVSAYMNLLIKFEGPAQPVEVPTVDTTPETMPEYEETATKYATINAPENHELAPFTGQRVQVASDSNGMLNVLVYGAGWFYLNPGEYTDYSTDKAVNAPAELKPANEYAPGEFDALPQFYRDLVIEADALQANVLVGFDAHIGPIKNRLFKLRDEPAPAVVPTVATPQADAGTVAVDKQVYVVMRDGSVPLVYGSSAAMLADPDSGISCDRNRLNYLARAGYPVHVDGASIHRTDLRRKAKPEPAQA